MIGTLFNDRYRLEAEIGRGGMGVVYRAHDTLLERDVALKVWSASELGTEGRSHLLSEARAAAQLNHPNVVAVYDASEAQGAPLHRDGVGGWRAATRRAGGQLATCAVRCRLGVRCPGT